MALDLSTRQCFNHAAREAVAKCPGCGRFFCRECVTEHDSRVLCAQCIPGAGKHNVAPLRKLKALVRLGQFALAFFVIWFTVFMLGKGLMLLPASFSETPSWQTDVKE
jgi:hypothetical protein